MNSDRGIEIYSIVLKLVPTREVRVRATMGYQAHAAFLRTVRELDAAGEPQIYRKTQIRDTLIRAFPPILAYESEEPWIPRITRIRNTHPCLSANPWL